MRGEQCRIAQRLFAAMAARTQQKLAHEETAK